MNEWMKISTTISTTVAHSSSIQSLLTDSLTRSIEELPTRDRMACGTSRWIGLTTPNLDDQRATLDRVLVVRGSEATRE